MRRTTTVIRSLLGPVPLAVAAAAGGALSVAANSWWWGLPTTLAAFAAGRGRGRTGPTALALLTLLAAGVTAVWVLPGRLGSGGLTHFPAVVVLAMMLPWFAGRFVRQYRQLVRAGWEKAGHVDRERELVAREARLRERARIAQDMHDVLGHDLSLIALSAGALKLAPGLAEEHRASAADIRGRAEAAVERLGEVVGVLREEDAGAPLRTADDDVPRLVEEAAASGLDVTLHADGEARGVPHAVRRAAHRVVQEALTNAARHAPGATVAVRLTHTPADTEVEVVNGPPASPAGAPPGGGRGLAGLDERVRLTGGRLAHGPREGGYAVTARLPHDPQTVPSSPEPAVRVRPAARTARRRTVRVAVAAVLLPLLTAAGLSAALLAPASRTVLDAQDWERLRVGQERSAVAALLPERQAAERPATDTGPKGEPKGPDTRCEYYAVTADPMDDRSGDTYRLCFQRGRLVSKDVLEGR